MIVICLDSLRIRGPIQNVPILSTAQQFLHIGLEHATVDLSEMSLKHAHPHPGEHVEDVDVSLGGHEHGSGRGSLRYGKLEAGLDVVWDPAVIDHHVGSSRGVPQSQVIVRSKTEQVQAVGKECDAVDETIVSCVDCKQTKFTDGFLCFFTSG